MTAILAAQARAAIQAVGVAFDRPVVGFIFSENPAFQGDVLTELIGQFAFG